MNVKDAVLSVLEEKRGESFSGAELAEKLGVSRNAVWKAVKKLQEQGYLISAVTNKGYCLSADNDILSRQSIEKYLSDKYKKLDIEVYDTIDSTNTRVKEYAAEGRNEGLVVIAQCQTAGRGRRGRSFYSPDKSGVYMSFLFRPHFSVQESLNLTTAAAVAAAEAIEEASGVRAEIKWVNDVFCHGKKVCGILTEASVNVENGLLDYAVTGIGFNIREPEGGFPEEIKNIAGAIYNDDVNGTDTLELRSRIAAGMINHFMEYYEHLTEKLFMKEYRERSFLIGKKIYTLTTPIEYGIAKDIDEDGHLIMEMEDGSIKCLSSGEVSVRPAED